VLFCYKCGTQVNEGGSFCHCCGTPLAQQTQPQSQPVNYNYVKPKIPGRGLGIAGMVLGIIGLVYTFSMFITALDYFYSYFGVNEGLITVIIFFSIFPILAVSLAGAGRHKGYRTSVSTSGVVMGVIGLVLSFLALIATLVA